MRERLLRKTDKPGGKTDKAKKKRWLCSGIGGQKN